MPTKLGHILETQQFKDRKLLDELYFLADEMRLFDKENLGLLERYKCKRNALPCKPRRKILANVFYEPSTRTRFSFESAMRSLGGDVISTESAGIFSSAAKGESLPDSIRVIGGYADVIVLRHPEEGAAKMAARYSRVPVINAGDGPGQHPTQALLDRCTIKRERGTTDNLNVGMLGDLKNGRTVRSLTYLLAQEDNIRFHFISPQELKMRNDIIQYLEEHNISFEEVTGEALKDVARNLDVLYVTRIQKERFKNPEEYEKLKGCYVVDHNVIDVMPGDSIIMHPLPKIDEIAPEVDYDKRAAYFRQSDNGKYVRMALLKMILDGS